MKQLPHTRSCFVCGEANPLGLNLRFESDGQSVRGQFVPKPEHSGFRETVHGGLISTVLDEVMVWACAVQMKCFAVCAELNVRFLHPVRPGQATIASAELTANRRGRIFETKAELRDEQGLLLAAATGKYLPVKGPQTAPLVTDFVGDASWLLSAAGPGTTKS